MGIQGMWGVTVTKVLSYDSYNLWTLYNMKSSCISTSISAYAFRPCMVTPTILFSFLFFLSSARLSFYLVKKISLFFLMRNGGHQLAMFCKMIFHISKYIVPLSWWNEKIRVMNIHETEKVIQLLRWDTSNTSSQIG